MILLFEKNVARLDIPVDNSPRASIVHHVQGFRNLDEAMPDKVLGKAGVVLHSMPQISPFAVLEPFDKAVVVVVNWLEREAVQHDQPSAAREHVL